MEQQAESDSGSSAVLFIGGRSGVGKTSVCNEIHGQLSGAGVRHCVIDGDLLDMAFPAPWECGFAERNLAAMWTNYRELGYRRLIYVNTASVMVDETERLTAAMGDRPTAFAVLLRCSDETVRRRLAQREVGSALDQHLKRSATAAVRLDHGVPDWVHRVDTDTRSVIDVAAGVIDYVGWTATEPSESVAGSGPI